MDVRMMQRREVCKVFGTSSAGLHRGMHDGRFPRPYRTGLNSVRWRSDEIQQTIEGFSQVTADTTKPVAPGSKRGRKPSYLACKDDPNRKHLADAQKDGVGIIPGEFSCTAAQASLRGKP